METSKLIETLRFCGGKESCCSQCPSGDRVTEYTATECLCDLMQKAANAIEELRLQLESHRDSENAIRMEEKQATSDGWISVKDRLPEKNTDVLIYNIEEYMGTDFLTKDGKWFWNEELPPTHWMPLPEPPKGE